MYLFTTFTLATNEFIISTSPTYDFVVMLLLTRSDTGFLGKWSYVLKMVSEEEHI